MKSDQMWQAYKILNQTIGDKIDAWAFWRGSRLFGRARIDGAKDSNQIRAFDLYAVGMNHCPRKMN